jgi:transposase
MPPPHPEAVVRLETAPAHQAQVDFAEFPFPWGKRSALLVVPAQSWLLWLEFYPRQKLEPTRRIAHSRRAARCSESQPTE